jgi:hypothetical protein
MRASQSGVRLRALRRVLISVFVVLHLSATVLWVLPPCPLRARCIGVVQYYMVPMGFWQYWGMFAPDPQRDSMTLEAEVIDARGIRSTFAFPKMADYPTQVAKLARFRYPKYAANLLMPDTQVDRKLSARHALRRLDLPDDAYPLTVSLVYHVRVAPPPGGPPADPMTPPQPFVACTLPFASSSEARP